MMIDPLLLTLIHLLPIGFDIIMCPFMILPIVEGGSCCLDFILHIGMVCVGTLIELSVISSFSGLQGPELERLHFAFCPCRLRCLQGKGDVLVMRCCSLFANQREPARAESNQEVSLGSSL